VVVLVGISTFVGFFWGLSGQAHAAQQTTEQAEATLTVDLNQERTSRGLDALTVASDLVDYARQHSADMAAAGRPYHDPNIQSNVQNWQELGDNVGSGPDADHVHQGFMNSQKHRDDILHPTYTEVGVGCYWAGNVLYVTEVFRRPMEAQAPPTVTKNPPVHVGPPARVDVRASDVRVPAAPAPAPTAPPTTAAAPPTTAASTSTSTSLVAAAAPQWPQASFSAKRAASHGAGGPSTSAVAVVAALLLLVVASVQARALRRRAERS